MTSWKLCLLVLLAVFVALALETDAFWRTLRRGRRRQNRGQGDNTEVTATDDSASDNTPDVSGGDNSVVENTGRGRGAGGRTVPRGGRRGRGNRPGRGRGGRGRGRGRRPTTLGAVGTGLLADYATANGFFAYSMFRGMTSRHDNFAISPIGVHAGLGMLLVGASGETRNQLMRSISAGILPDVPIHPGFKIYNQSLALGQDENTTFMMANALYTRPDFNPKNRYLRRLRRFYDTALSTFDDEEPENAINDWVASKTMNKIQDFIEDGSITNDTLMMLLNAVYFKGLWKHGFDEAQSGFGNFRDDHGVTSRVQMMSVEADFKFSVSDFFRSSILKMPYKGGRYSMYFIVPNHNTELNTFHSMMNHETLSEYLDDANDYVGERRVRVTIPKFKIDTDQALKEMLSSSGLTSIFQDDADFSRMTCLRVKVKEVQHRCILEIDEVGTEAAAATSVEKIPIMAVPEFRADKPFMFVLRDDAAKINLFMGRYTNPRGSNLIRD